MKEIRAGYWLFLYLQGKSRRIITKKKGREEGGLGKNTRILAE